MKKINAQYLIDQLHRNKDPYEIQGIKKALRNYLDHYIAVASDLSEADQSGWTPLHIAALLGDHTLVQKLFDNGASFGDLSKCHCTSSNIHTLIHINNILKQEYTSWQTHDNIKLNPIKCALLGGNIDIVKLYIDLVKQDFDKMPAVKHSRIGGEPYKLDPEKAIDVILPMMLKDPFVINTSIQNNHLDILNFFHKNGVIIKLNDYTPALNSANAETIKLLFKDTHFTQHTFPENALVASLWKESTDKLEIMLSAGHKNKAITDELKVDLLFKVLQCKYLTKANILMPYCLDLSAEYKDSLKQQIDQIGNGVDRTAEEWSNIDSNLGRFLKNLSSDKIESKDIEEESSGNLLPQDASDDTITSTGFDVYDPSLLTSGSMDISQLLNHIPTDVPTAGDVVNEDM